MNRNRFTKNTGRSLLGLCMSVLMLTACGETVQEEPVVSISEAGSELNYELISVIKTDVVKTDRIRVEFSQTKQQNAAFLIGGRIIDKIYVQRGDEVKAGDLLAQLDIGTLEDDIDRQKYQIQVLETKLGFLDTHKEYDLEASYNSFAYGSAKEEDDLKNLEKRNELIDEDYTYQREDLEDEIEYNRMQLADMEKQLSDSRLYAEMSGMVSFVANDLERSVCKRDETIMTIIDGKEGIWAMEDKKGYAQYFSEGDMLDLNVSTGSSRGDYVVTPFDMSDWGDTLWFSIVEGPENDGVDVGTVGYIEVILDKAEDVNAVLADAVYKADSGYYVYVCDEEGMKTIKWVEVGLIGDEYAEITSGLSVGDQIVRR